MKKISIGTWAYSIGPYANDPVPWVEVITTLKKLGFDGVELGSFGVHPNPDNLTTKEQRQECRKQLQDIGLEWSGIAANLWGEKLINTPDPTEYIQCFRKNIEFCEDLGIKGIRVDTVQPPTIFSEVDPETARKRVVETWKVCAKEAAAKGMYVTWEFEPGFAFNKPSDVLRILEEIPDENFGVQYDTCHGQMVAVNGARQPGQKETLKGGQLEFIEKLSGRINHIHLIDSDNSCHKDDKGEDETSTHAPFGEGVINFDEVVPALNKAARLPHNWWTIDLCFWADAWTVTERCKKSIDELNVKYGG